MLITNAGIVIRMPVNSISVIGRNTSGVKLMNVSQSEEIKVAGLARVPAEWIEEEETEWEELPAEDVREEALPETADTQNE